MNSSKITADPSENPFLSFEWSYTKVYEKDRQTYLEGEKRMMRDKVLEKRRALTMEVETIKDALNGKKLEDMIKVYMGQRGMEEYNIP